MGFRDHFSGTAAGYATFRPRYPDALFSYLAGVAARRGLVWDCGCGTGQAATSLARHFARVVATDASVAQVAHAARDPRVAYAVARAEESPLPSGAADLVTVAQAIHWFDLEAFYAEARRVLAPGGVLAIWMYGDATIDLPAADDFLQRFSRDAMGPFWPAEREVIHAGAGALAFPFDEIDTPRFDMTQLWTLRHLAGYVRTWSATARYVAARREDPVVRLERALGAVWGDPATPRRVRWPLSLRVGRV
ncbi:MAG TPA: class I SAM-dependent methyltransferase [Gemmatimonadaceae bacterium]|nr:class I SAM-dependent methyltransferase [Gemmatimonadaceae bacterium]